MQNIPQFILAAFLTDATATAIGRFTLEGEALSLNAGMRLLLSCETGETPPPTRLVKPSFADMRQQAATATDVLLYRGWITFEGVTAPTRSVMGSVYAVADHFVIMAEHDIEELTAVNDKILEMNNAIINLQRDLARKQALLQNTLDELQQANERLTTLHEIVANSPVVAYTWEGIDSRRLIYVSDSVCHFGYEPEALMAGRSFNDIVHPDDRDRVDALITQAAQNNRSDLQLEYRVLSDQGAQHWVDDHIHLRWTTDETLACHGVAVDITPRKEAEKHRLALQLEQERSRILSDFITSTSHEFMTPITTLRMHIYLMERASDLDAVKQQIPVLRIQTETLQELVQALLTITDLNRQTEITHASVDLNRLLAEVCQRFANDIRSKGLALKVDFETSPLLLEGDTGNLVQAFRQLIKNAIQYTPSGGQITVHTHTTANDAILEVRDTGIGIPEAEQSRIFESFYRVDKARQERGAGLGLTITRRIVEQHHGTITVESAPGQGSTFRITLPLPSTPTTGQNL